MSMNKIVVLGSTNTDMVITDKRLPDPGETISGGKFLMNPGGKGANQAVAIARLSAKKGACEFIAKVGNDLFGRETAANMKRDKIDAKLIVDKKNASGTALILVDANGQNMISVALGANGTLSPKDIAPYEKRHRKCGGVADAAGNSGRDDSGGGEMGARGRSDGRPQSGAGEETAVRAFEVRRLADPE